MILDNLKKHNFYNGDRSKENQISVSEVSGGEVLQSYLVRAKNIPERNTISQATLGNIFDIGMRTLAIEGVLGESVLSGSRSLKILGNGFNISGECDLIDHENKIIYDVKLSKIYALKKLQSEPQHHYNLQLNYYRMMFGEDYKMVLLFGLKDQSELEGNKNYYESAIVAQEVKYIDNDYLINRAVKFSNDLQYLLSGGELPKKCNDTWGADLKCKSYCDVCSVCHYANGRGYNKSAIDSWVSKPIEPKQEINDFKGW